MDEISNKTLATLLVVAIVISLAGTFFAMRGVSQVTNIISGAQTANTQGTAQITVNTTAQMRLDVATVDFGTGQRFANITPATSCYLTSGTGVFNGTCWNNTAGSAPGDFVLENNGNANLSIEINSTAYNQFFVGGGGTDKPGEGDYEWQGQEDVAGRYTGCVGTLNATWNGFTDAEQDLCSNMAYDDNNDRFNISIRIDIPSGASGSFSHSVDFIGTPLG